MSRWKSLHFPPRAVRLIAADVRLRLGLLAALRGELARAVDEFQQADALGFDASSSVAVYANRRLTGQRLSPLPDPVHNGPDHSESLIRLALLFGESRELDRALRLWDALLAQKDAEISLPQRSFAHLHRGLVRSELTNPLERNLKQIAADYAAVAKRYPQADWADDALFFHANLAWNAFQNADAAVALWQQLLDQHPGSEHAPAAAYHVGLIHQGAKKWELAQAAYTDARQRFPESPFNKTIEEQLQKVEREVSRFKPATK